MYRHVLFGDGVYRRICLWREELKHTLNGEPVLGRRVGRFRPLWRKGPGLAWESWTRTRAAHVRTGRRV